MDAQTFNEHTVLNVPALTPSSRLSPQGRTLPNPAPRSVPSLHIPATAHAEPSVSHDPWPISAWCSPINSPTSSPRTHWPSGTLLPSIHDTGLAELNRSRAHYHLHNHQSQPPPPTVYADLRSNAAGSPRAGMFDLAPPAWLIPPGFRPTPPPPSSAELDPRVGSSWPPGGFAASGISSAAYEFVPPPASSHRYAMPINSQYSQAGQYHIEEDEEDKPVTRPSSPQDARDPRLQNLLMNLSQTVPPQPNLTNLTPSRARPSTNIRIVHHPATRTRAAYDEKNSCAHLSGMCFDPTGRWMYASTERSIAEWDMEEVLGGRYAGQESRGKMAFDGGAEWA